MIRRQFMGRITMAGVSAAMANAAAARHTVTYHIKGFTCIACAVGLETMLRQQKGVFRADASYPQATAHIEFDPAVVTEKSLRQFIVEMGFAVEGA